ncbi:AbrB family transcriptional regulator [Desertibacillus haloalkaliphilus]|uniref:AbrB family transcriptional regulator n=1 Tax=Desertibacillus haloalkaliphilus TaxID=1328930 RepID=UPI001C2606AD|nr:AbrB family transcriptional regulator [Desertibacillus haloalkaliphilus]MBU8906002.1 AbrB family transcriptional regulator [Desertibacillus haloalkaliphilus]
MLNFLLFLGVAAIGGFVGLKLRLPVGAMLGAMMAVALSQSFGILEFESGGGLLFGLQIALGAMLGVTFINFKKEYVKQLSFTIVVLTLGLVLMVVIIVSVLMIVTDLSLPITILSSSPGAIYEMAMLAKLVEEDAPAVVFLHLARVVIIMSLFPFVLKYFLKLLTSREKDEKCS